MAHYIDKDALAAEIEKLISNGQVKLQESQEYNDYESYVAWAEHIATCIKVLSVIDTLEVKEVDINKEISQFIDANFEKATIGHKLSLRRIAKHFFELGMAASNKAHRKENNMTQQDKAKELGQKYFPDSANILARGNIEAHAVESACMEMAEFVEQQFEVNRLAHCDELTKEQAQVESDFVTQHLKKNKRTPTFIDAIKYGRNSIIPELEKIVKSKEEKNRDYVFAFSEVKELIERLRHEDN